MQLAAVHDALRDLAGAAVGAPVGVAALAIDAADIALLAPAELALVATAGPVRRAEFATGRRALHGLLAELRIDAPGGDHPIGRGADGRPLLPAGVRGSLAHADGLVVAVVAGSPAVLGVGVDLERAGALPPEDAGSVVGPDDVTLGADPVVTLVVKEAAYKAWSVTRPAVALAPGAANAGRPSGFLDLQVCSVDRPAAGMTCVTVAVLPDPSTALAAGVPAPVSAAVSAAVSVHVAEVGGRWLAVAVATC